MLSEGWGKYFIPPFSSIFLRQVATNLDQLFRRLTVERDRKYLSERGVVIGRFSVIVFFLSVVRVQKAALWEFSSKLIRSSQSIRYCSNVSQSFRTVAAGANA